MHTDVRRGHCWRSFAGHTSLISPGKICIIILTRYSECKLNEFGNLRFNRMNQNFTSPTTAFIDTGICLLIQLISCWNYNGRRKTFITRLQKLIRFVVNIDSAELWGPRIHVRYVSPNVKINPLVVKPEAPSGKASVKYLLVKIKKKKICILILCRRYRNGFRQVTNESRGRS